MQLNKTNLSNWGILTGFIAGIFFMMPFIFQGDSIKHALWALVVLALIVAFVVGILIIVESHHTHTGSPLYKAGGILLLLIPLVGAILLLVERNSSKH